MALAEVGAGDFVTAETMNYVIQRAVNRPICRLVLPSGSQSIGTGVNVEVLWPSGSEVLDDLNWHSTSTNTGRITPTYPGRYLVQSNITFASGSATSRRVMILKNGGGLANWVQQVPAASTSITFGTTDVVEMNGTTDFLSTYVRQDTGGSLTILGVGEATGGCYFAVTYLGDSL